MHTESSNFVSLWMSREAPRFVLRVRSSDTYSGAGEGVRRRWGSVMDSRRGGAKALGTQAPENGIPLSKQYPGPHLIWSTLTWTQGEPRPCCSWLYSVSSSHCSCAVSIGVRLARMPNTNTCSGSRGADRKSSSSRSDTRGTFNMHLQPGRGSCLHTSLRSTSGQSEHKATCCCEGLCAEGLCASGIFFLLQRECS